jgi:Rrf2 family protein
MRVSAKTDYGLRALLVLAEHGPDLVTIEAVSRAEGMPRKFVELILGELRRAGLVVSRRGSVPVLAVAVDHGPDGVTELGATGPSW